MEILVIGDESNLKECRGKFGESHKYSHSNHEDAPKHFKQDMVVFDFLPKDLSIYNRAGLVVFLNTALTRLSLIARESSNDSQLFGFCGLPSFLDREILEVTALNLSSLPHLEKVCSDLNTKFKLVKDSVGMITPRVICMIINEAYFAIEEKVASRADIDQAMKLGTNYPFGPFEWCTKIGIKNVYHLLKAVSDETKDERYKICSLLEKEALA